MILPDVNLLVYAYDLGSPNHGAAGAWWGQTIRGGERVGLPWAVAMGFVRVSTAGPRATEPELARRAVTTVEKWLGQPQVSIIEPGPQHLLILAGLLKAVGVAGKLTSDAHLAAIAIEHDAVVHSTDRDFARFPGVRWHNPLLGS